MGRADLDKETRRAMQRLSREEMKHRIYADIFVDMMVCDIEGWDKIEYVRELQDMLNNLTHKKKIILTSKRGDLLA